jgi:hypothetical protein
LLNQRGRGRYFQKNLNHGPFDSWRIVNLKNIAMIVAAAIALVILSFWFPKWRLDREVDRLCAIDGGIRIYEKVTLSAENFGPYGDVFPQYRHLGSKGGHLGPDYYSRSERKILEVGNPKLVRSSVRIFRKKDQKLLGEDIAYTREGGDMYGPWQPSVYRCKQSADSKITLNQIFVKG